MHRIFELSGSKTRCDQVLASTILGLQTLSIPTLWDCSVKGRTLAARSSSTAASVPEFLPQSTKGSPKYGLETDLQDLPPSQAAVSVAVGGNRGR